MLELSRDLADGAHPYLVTPQHTALAREILGEGPLLVVSRRSEPSTTRTSTIRLLISSGTPKGWALTSRPTLLLTTAQRLLVRGESSLLWCTLQKKTHLAVITLVGELSRRHGSRVLGCSGGCVSPGLTNPSIQQRAFMKSSAFHLQNAVFSKAEAYSRPR